MDCCTIANTCVVSFVASLTSLFAVAILWFKTKQIENNQEEK